MLHTTTRATAALTLTSSPSRVLTTTLTATAAVTAAARRASTMAGHPNLNQQRLINGGSYASASHSTSTRASTAGSRQIGLLFASGGSTWASADVRAYQQRYPGQRQDRSANRNLDFYQNRISSAPRPAGKIDAIHIQWRGDYDLLEQHHGYIQWLFPIREDGLNACAQMLFLHEAAAIQADPEAQRRLIVSYKLMLDFYGMQLVDEQLGLVARAANYRSRYAHLNRSFHNYLRVTRILKCLGELGREELKLGFLLHIVRELVEGELSAKSVGKSAVNYWFPILREASDRQRLQSVVDELKEAEARGSTRVQLTEARIREVLEEARADRLQGQTGAAASHVTGGSSAAAAAAASPSIRTDANEMSEEEEEEDADDQNDADSPRAEAEGMAASRSASEVQSTASDDDADGRTQAASASTSSAAAATVSHAKRKAADDMATDESTRAKKGPTPTNSAGRA